jgi:hypothetical protein
MKKIKEVRVGGGGVGVVLVFHCIIIIIMIDSFYVHKYLYYTQWNVER